MDPETVMSMLEESGSAQTRRIYLRHGAGEPVFGVSYGELNRLAKKIKTDHALAVDLWATGNHDARELAAKIVDKDRVTKALARRWLADTDNYVSMGSVAGVVANSPHARELSDEWRDQSREWTAAAGWLLVAYCAERSDVFSGDDLGLMLQQIETEIHDRANRVRHEMNQALIAIALRDEDLRKQAIDAAGRIGTVMVDHGRTGCKTPDAVSYINKTVAYRARRAARNR